MKRSTLAIMFLMLKISTRTFQTVKNHSFPAVVSSFSLSSLTTTNSGRKESRRHLSGNDNNGGLEWERFDFSDSPKWDHRFKGDEGLELLEGTAGSSTATATTPAPISKRAQKRKRKQDGGIPNDLIHVASNSEDWESVHERETLEDEKLHDEFQKRHRAWDDLDPVLIEQATGVLRPYLKPERQERIRDVLGQRTKQTRFLFENPSNPSNVWACLRTLDSYGIQHVDVVIQSGRYKGKAALSQKRGMRTAMGSAQWLTLRNHLSTKSALQTMKDEGYHILYTDVNPTSKDIRDIDWDASGKPVCIVMGNEAYGVSDTVREYADESFYLPMRGFAESFSLSVATASLCAYLLCASAPVPKEQALTPDDGIPSNEDENDAAINHYDRPKTCSTGPLRPGDLSEKEYDTLFLKGCLNSVNGKTARALLRKNGLSFPKELQLT
mmetsp:Transcript_7591/g.18739  ORF Transcript_7591/g.18739 Transcript_7591/m.18739 type:complete len:440 (-) Transcript_7591:810-2129(-)